MLLAVKRLLVDDADKWNCYTSLTPKGGVSGSFGCERADGQERSDRASDSHNFRRECSEERTQISTLDIAQ
jgi:hypothetical protein